MYKRKTKDVYILLGNWGDGWDEVLEEDTFKEIKMRYKEYVENDKRAIFQVKKVRRKIEQIKD